MFTIFLRPTPALTAALSAFLCGCGNSTSGKISELDAAYGHVADAMRSDDCDQIVATLDELATALERVSAPETMNVIMADHTLHKQLNEAASGITKITDVRFGSGRRCMGFPEIREKITASFNRIQAASAALAANAAKSR